VRNRTAYLALAAFLALGLPDGMRGPAWPSIRGQLGQPLAALGELTALISAGFVVSTVVSGRVQRRVGPGGYVAAGAAGGTIALALFASSQWWVGLLAASFAVGLFAGAVDAGFNAHAALYHGPRLMNALHAAYGVGATLGPLAVAAALAAGSWRWAWTAAAALDAIVCGALLLTRRDLPGGAPERWDKRQATAQRRGALPLMLVLFFLIVGLESAIGAWSPTLLQHRGLGRGATSAWVASFWACFTAGRVVLALAGRRISPGATLRASAAVALLGVALLAATPAGLPVAGLGLAGFFPALVTLTPFRLGADRAAAAIGYQFAAGTLGSTVLVGSAGLTAQFAGVGALVPYFAAVAVALVALELLVARSAALNTRVP
jgi:fucose permease